MRVLTTRTPVPVLVEVHPCRHYAILSHRWREAEVTYQDFIQGSASEKFGYRKLLGACQMAAILGFDYLWMDTCGIDKSSSAELQEAINSMYVWYKQAGICIAYLDDIGSRSDDIGASIWFTRGWTLQELLAPSEVLFFTKSWDFFGTKTGMCRTIEEITGISAAVLCSGQTDNISIATKMSWASGRDTTRVEDQAYCLLGIFDINMPTIYGEGQKAFKRLQEEILKKSNDQTILAWGTRQI